MSILPVLDVVAGKVVRGVAGRRAEYRLLVSAIVAGVEPLAVARAFRERYGFTELYLADLDAIAGQPPALPLFTQLQDEGFRLWVDAGIGDVGDARPLAAAGIASIVVGLETVRGPSALAHLIQELGPARLVFSLDLKADRPLGSLDDWPTPTALGITQTALALGVQRLLLLDLARVGLGGGTGTEALCAQLRPQAPSIQLSAGGGIRDHADAARLQAHGVNVVLVASALHRTDWPQAPC